MHRPIEEPKKEPTMYTKIRMCNPEMQLRRIANHPFLVQMPIEVVDGEKLMLSSERVISESGKLLALNAMLLKLRQKGHKVSIASDPQALMNRIKHTK